MFTFFMFSYVLQDWVLQIDQLCSVEPAAVSFSPLFLTCTAFFVCLLDAAGLGAAA
jgi:hypothetical protein